VKKLDQLGPTMPNLAISLKKEEDVKNKHNKILNKIEIE